MAAKKTYTWDKYVKEAEIDPFPLVVSDKETLVFECPDGVALMRVMQGLRSGDLELILTNIAGENWPRLRELFGKAGHKALPAITEDLMDHFDLYEDVRLTGPGGGTVTAKRPTEINALLRQGYTLPGEAHAS